MFSFGHCPNYLPPISGNLYIFFRMSKPTENKNTSDHIYPPREVGDKRGGDHGAWWQRQQGHITNHTYIVPCSFISSDILWIVEPPAWWQPQQGHITKQLHSWSNWIVNIVKELIWEFEPHELFHTHSSDILRMVWPHWYIHQRSLLNWIYIYVLKCHNWEAEWSKLSCKQHSVSERNPEWNKS